ncbi:hypothetical protein CPB86DRAFT_810749 [Serendipita vermifera]|nr:hypothetical protein CPB86DRAFT_810749 [Serendipita vermifera]
MFSRLWSSRSTSDLKQESTPTPAEKPDESSGSASPPPPSVLTESGATPAPKPKKPRKSTKKSPLAGESAPDASNADGTLQELKELIAQVPPKTLHSFMVERLDAQKSGRKKKPSPKVYKELEKDFPVLGSFFTGLVLPPKLHCVRCHTDYVEIENGPRSCVKEHDDDSARVIRSEAGIHQTFWGCCGQTVDGDGDQGPPTGWCYEGLHTTNREEARYRNDAEATDDKLGDCAKLRCGQANRKPKRKRASSVDEDSNEDVPISALEPRERHARRKSEAGAHGRNQSRTRLEDILSDEDVVMSDATVEKAKPGPKPKKKAPTAAEKAAAKAAETIKEKEETPAKEEGTGKGKGKGKGGAAAGAATTSTTATGGRGKGKKDADAKPEKKESASATKPKETAKAAKKRKTED